MFLIVRAPLAALGLLVALSSAGAQPTAPDSSAARPAADSAAAARAGSRASASAPSNAPAPAFLARGWRLKELGAIEGNDSHPLVEPSGVLSDAFGRVWVSDAALHKLRRWTPDGAPLDEAGALGSEPAQFRRPGSLARVGSLGVAVLDIENRRISTYDHHLRLLDGTVELDAPDLEARVGHVRPLAIASDRGGALYVADAERDRVLVFDYSGEFQRELGGFGGRSGGFSGLAGVAVGARGRIVTVERPRAQPKKSTARDTTVGRSRVQWLEAGGRVLASYWTPPFAAGASELSLAVAVDGIGRIAVCAERSGELCVLSVQGECLLRLAGLASPRAVAFADDGTLLVAEAGAGRVRRWTLEPAGTE